MPKIVITEIDETTPGTNSDSFEVVYIPGCVDSNQKSLYSKGKYVGLEINKPTLFTSVSAFEALCGTQGLTFTEDKDYRSLISKTSTGFAADAVPYDSIMFKKDDIDPAYIMAKELLAAGMNVLYERINKDYTLQPAVLEKDLNDKVVGDFANWEESYKDFFAEMDKVVRVPDAVPPVLGMFGSDKVVAEVIKTTDKKPVQDSKGNVTKTYYTLDTIDKNSYVEFTGNKFDEDKDYFVQGRTFYLTASEDDTAEPTAFQHVMFQFNLEGKITNLSKTDYYMVDLVELYPLTEIPQDWATNYWNNYWTVIKTTENIPGCIYNNTSVKAPDIEDLIDTYGTIYKAEKGVNLAAVYNALEGVYDASAQEGLADKGNFNIKYITSGGYPVYEYNSNSIVSKMKNLAETRGDCVAIIDHTDNLYRESNINLVGSLYKAVAEDDLFQTGGEYATLFTPWATYLRTTTDKENGVALNGGTFRMPASFAYLTSLADSVKTNASWLAVAGATRGVVGNLASGGMTTEIPNGAADAMQPRQGIAVNAITNIKPYGYTIWGNRTLKKNVENLTATSFLNIRNLVSDVKKTCYRAARSLTFEQNTEVLWVNFKSKIAPTLDRMLSGYGISGYKIIRDTQHEKAAEKATICAKVILYPVYAVEDFYITIVLKDDEISVESAE